MRNLKFTGVANSGLERTVIRAIIVDPSAGAAVVVLKDSKANVIFQCHISTLDTKCFGPGLDIDADAVNVTTATNVSLIQVICD